MIQFPPTASGDTELFGEPYRLSLLSLAAHIVIIDDELSNVRLLTTVLQRSGFMTITGLTDARQLRALVVTADRKSVV